MASRSRIESRTASEIWSASLSGCPSVTDSEVKRWGCVIAREYTRAVRRRCDPRPRKPRRSAGAAGGTLREGTGDAVAERGRKSGLRPNDERGLLAAAGQDRGAI